MSTATQSTTTPPDADLIRLCESLVTAPPSERDGILDRLNALPPPVSPEGILEKTKAKLFALGLIQAMIRDVAGARSAGSGLTCRRSGRWFCSPRMS
jgi:hypothetical protein